MFLRVDRGPVEGVVRFGFAIVQFNKNVRKPRLRIRNKRNSKGSSSSRRTRATRQRWHVLKLRRVALYNQYSLCYTFREAFNPGSFPLLETPKEIFYWIAHP
jgi:hypothetical protein